MTFSLAYLEGTPLGDKFPLWVFGKFNTREAAEAVRHQCHNVSQIKVVETDG